MRLTGLSVKGYKSLRDFNVSEIDPITAFIGANNSGKSALLEVLVYLSLLTDSPYFERLSRGVDTDDWFKDVTTDHSMSPVSVQLELEISPEEVSELQDSLPGIKIGPDGLGSQLKFDFQAGVDDSPRNITVTAASWSYRGQQFPYIYRDGSDLRVINLTDIAQLPPDTALRIRDNLVIGKQSTRVNLGLDAESDDPNLLIIIQLMRWLGGIKWLGPERAFATGVSVQGPVPDELAALPRVLQHLYNNDRATFDRVEELLRQLVPSIRRILTPINTENMTTSTRLASEHVESALVHSGHGVSSVLSIIVELTKCQEGTLVLLEEPETSLHPGAQRALLRVFEEFAKKRNIQILITTHSPVFARDSETFGTISVKLQHGGTIANKVSGSEFSLIKQELGAQNSDLFMANMVLFCEDESTANYLPTAFSLLGFDLSVEGVKLIPLRGGGKRRITRLREYLGYLKDSGVLHFIVLDDDEGTLSGLQQLVSEGALAKDEFHLWSKGKKPAEFEDNFSVGQLVTAANAVASDSGRDELLEPGKLEARQAAKGENKISKELAVYYNTTYDHSLSKPQLSAKLAEIAAEQGANSVPQPFRRVLEHIRQGLEK